MYPNSMHEDEHYMVFSSRLPQETVERILKSHWIGYKVLTGPWRGVAEISYIVNVLAFNSTVFTALMTGQPGVMILGPVEDKVIQKRKATMYTSTYDEDVDLGYLIPVTPEFAEAKGRYIYDPSTRTWYITTSQCFEEERAMS